MKQAVTGPEGRDVQPGGRTVAGVEKRPDRLRRGLQCSIVAALHSKLDQPGGLPGGEGIEEIDQRIGHGVANGRVRNIVFRSRRIDRPASLIPVDICRRNFHICPQVAHCGDEQRSTGSVDRQAIALFTSWQLQSPDASNQAFDPSGYRPASSPGAPVLRSIHVSGPQMYITSQH